MTKEKEFTRLKDELSRQRRELPWEKVTKSYVFDGPKGKETLADLFEGRSQLVVYHFMFGPAMKEGCKSCSLVADHFDAIDCPPGARDVTLLVISRAPLPTLEAYKRRMGWSFKWVSIRREATSTTTSASRSPKEQQARGVVPYNYGTLEYSGAEKEGASVFARNGEDVFHTYSTYGRGVEALMGTYSYLDLVPKGRDEEGLDFPMAWVRHHDRYQG